MAHTARAAHAVDWPRTAEDRRAQRLRAHGLRDLPQAFTATALPAAAMSDPSLRMRALRARSCTAAAASIFPICKSIDPL